MLQLIQSEVQKLNELFPLIAETFNNVLALDIETAAADAYTDVDNAELNPWTAKITRIGLVGYYNNKLVVKSFNPDNFNELESFLASIPNVAITGHNAKFDFKHLIQKGLLTKDSAKLLWAHDSNIAAALSTKKVPEYYITDYEARRNTLNKMLPHGKGHRKAGPGSLKMLAPYFLGIEPFWESTLDHSDPRYNLLDCLYTYYLTAILVQHVIGDLNASRCYSDLIDRSKLLLEAELDGITLDTKETKVRMEANAAKLIELEAKIKAQWANHFEHWRRLQLGELQRKYESMAEAYLMKRQTTADKDKITAKYLALFEKAVAKADLELNINSVEQLKWLLRDALGYDITGFDGEEAADKEVLMKLSEEHEDIQVLMEYKKAKKLQSTYYPELLNYARFDGRVHCNFNITGARTGRLSSSDPNLQNQPGHIHDLFIAAPGNELITKDLSALEPVLIAYFTEDENLIKIVQSGASFHSVNAKEIFNLECSVDDVAKLYPKERKAAKEFGLSILYGAGANRVRQSLKKQGYAFSLDECKQMVYRVRDYYSGVWAFKQQLDIMFETGETIYNYLGRPIKFDNAEDVYMQGFNTLIQGSGSDILCQAVTDLCKTNSWISLRLLVHDEAVIEVPESRAEEGEKLLEYHMTKFSLPTKLGPVTLRVEGKRGKSWEK